MKRFKNILYVVAPGSINGVALEHAVTLANHNQARLTVIQVIKKIPPTITVNGRTLSTEYFREKSVTQHQQNLQTLLSSLKHNIETQTKILFGTSFLEIIHEVLRNKHDLVIKTAETEKLLDRLFGSDDMHLLRKCPCPVWLIKPTSPKNYQQILAAVDVDDDYLPEELNTRQNLNIQILEMASSLVLSECTKLAIVSAWEATGEDLLRNTSIGNQEDVIAYVEQIRQQHQNNLNVLINKTNKNLNQEAALNASNLQVHLLKGSPSEEIPLLSKKIEADLVIMGTVARTGISGFFIGNTAESILNQLNCSVLAIKPQGFQTPVTLED